MTSRTSRRAHVVGLGLIGGSVALALGARGWSVSGEDLDRDAEQSARDKGVITADPFNDDVSLAVVATPAGEVARAASALLARHGGEDLIVTDVAGVKAPIVRDITDPRFLGGHPMAGSELRGLAGARAELFRGCTWVLTPTEATDAAAYARLHTVLRELEANVIALDAETHDRLVALASHVPHLTAGALMNEASAVAAVDGALLQLAAGGFRDMTRVAAGDPTIWPDLLMENAAAVTAALGALRDRLGELERAIAGGDRDSLLSSLRAAAAARRQLPGRAVHPEELARLRVVVTDEPGVLARATTTAGDLSINLYDLEIAHSVEGQPGVLLLAVDRHDAGTLAGALAREGFAVTIEETA